MDSCLGDNITPHTIIKGEAETIIPHFLQTADLLNEGI
jgi:hypothetical protein